jgi:hypothetical protein
VKVYESVIQIRLYQYAEEVESTDLDNKLLKALRLRYFRPTKKVPVGVRTPERGLIRLLELRASGPVVSFVKYIHSHHNCVLNLLYAIFGADIIAYLFDQAWVPATTVVPFRPRLFLKRLSVLELAVDKLRDGAKMPIWLAETDHYLRPGMGPRLNRFSAKYHGLLLKWSLRELRAFGEFGLTLSTKTRPPRVEISILNSVDLDDPEVSPFVAGRTSKDREPAPRLPARLLQK